MNNDFRPSKSAIVYAGLTLLESLQKLIKLKLELHLLFVIIDLCFTVKQRTFLMYIYTQLNDFEERESVGINNLHKQLDSFESYSTILHLCVIGFIFIHFGTYIRKIIRNENKNNDERI